MPMSMAPNAPVCSSLRLFARLEGFFIAARAPGFLVAASVALGCGGAVNTPSPAAAPAPKAVAAPERRPAATATAEIGGLDERAAEASFRASLDGLRECVQSGVERLAFMGGSIEFAVKVGADHQAASVWAPQSSLGERSTEKCMFDALRAVKWPAPQGGLFGIARNSFEFERPKGSPAPAVWDAGRVAGVVEHVHRSIAECGDGSLGSMLITLYIGEEGRALAGGAASDEPLVEALVDCVVDALRAAKYARPERAPAKVRFRL
jgi:hypothetical protein